MFQTIIPMIANSCGLKTRKKLTKNFAVYEEGSILVKFERLPEIEEKLKELYPLPNYQFVAYTSNQTGEESREYELFMKIDGEKYLIGINLDDLKTYRRVQFFYYTVDFQTERVYQWKIKDFLDHHQKAIICIRNDFFEMVKSINKYRLIFLTEDVTINY